VTPPELAKIEPGLEGSCERVVSLEWTLAHYDPKLPAVFSTPAMIGLMEMATSHTIRHALPPGTLTVGTRIEVDHLKAVPAGVTVIARARLVEVNGKRFIFTVEAFCGTEIIGRGRVHQALVEHSRFVAIAAEKPPSP
jgi:fluoroacetyl-CoA thioesterase